MNSISISGQLGRDSEQRFMPNGDAILSFSVADSLGKDKPTIWWNCALFGKRGESLAPYLKKGQAVTVIGTVSEREYTNKEGAKVKATDVKVSDVALMGSRTESEPKRPSHDAAKSRQLAPKQDFDNSEEIPF